MNTRVDGQRGWPRSLSVASTRLENMTDFLLVSSSHAFIMRSDAITEQVVRFLSEGRFRHDDYGDP